MTKNERFLILETMCKLALAGKSIDDISAFGRQMMAFVDNKPYIKSMDEICEEAKKRAGLI